MMETKEKLARNLGRTLLAWSLPSIVFGVILSFVSDPFIQGIGLQAILWGVIDAVIALAGFYRKQDQSAEKMAKILLINVFLDIGYQVVGLLLVTFLWQNLYILGNGAGVIIQGAFLFCLDLYYYLKFKRLGETRQANQPD
ncbi:hypothetical protein EU538_09735 [Candidatus Thorarchaeota archaeon]|nr:MAG: hypothetical protein EU538_09735 [Candidatus Thorarchaeota archaeon]